MHFQLKCLSFLRDARLFLNIEYMIYCNQRTYAHSKKQFATKWHDFEDYEDTHIEEVGKHGISIEVDTNFNMLLS